MATKRVTPKAIAIVNTLEEADSTLARIAEIEREITLENTALNDKIAQMQLAVNERLAPFLQEKETLEQGLARFGEENKETLFGDKVRSRALPFGTIGFSASSELVTINNTPWKRVLALLQEHNLNQYIREKPEVNKEALENADPDTLKSVRCRIKAKDAFYYKLKNHAEESTKNAA